MLSIRRCVAPVSRAVLGLTRSAHSLQYDFKDQPASRDLILNMELSEEQLYRKLSTEAPEPLDDLFLRLAEEERKHHELLESGFIGGKLPSMQPSDIVSVAKEVFKTIEKDRAVSKEMKGMVGLFKRARDMEATARDKYLEMAEKETNPDAKKAWEQMAAEEHKHYKALEDMVEFISKSDVWYYW